MGKTKELLEDMQDVNASITQQEDYDLYNEAIHHDTYLLADTGDKVKCLMDFRDVDIVGEVRDSPGCSVVIIDKQPYVIFTEPSIANELWKRVR